MRGTLEPRFVAAATGMILFCCASFAAQIAPEPEKPAFPSGFSEIEILRLAIDNYEIKLKEWTEKGGTVEGHCEICGARVTELQPLDIKPRKYFVALINGQYGDCTQCWFSAIALLDMQSKIVVWRAQPKGHHASDLKIFSYLAGAEGPFVQFDIEIGVPEHRNHILRRLIYRLASRELGIVTADLFWSDLVEFENGGAWGMIHEGCGTIRSLNANQFEYRQKTFYGPSSAKPVGLLPPEFSPPQCKYEEGGHSVVVIHRTERWTGGSYRAIPVRASIKTVRVGGSAGDPFPFGLPVRNKAWRLRETESGNREMIRGSRVSPDGRWRVKETAEGLGVIDMSNRSLIRSIEFRNDWFDGISEALGWESRSHRLFAIVRFGFGEDKALLSFSVSGQDDYWEKLLTDDPTEWRDGFVLEPAKPVAKRAARKAGKK